MVEPSSRRQRHAARTREDVEAAGHYPVRSEEAFESLTLSKAFGLVHEASLGESEFQLIKTKVSELLS